MNRYDYDVLNRYDYCVGSFGDTVVKTYDARHPTGYMPWTQQQVEVIKSYDQSSCKCYIVPPHLHDQIKVVKQQSEDAHTRSVAGVHDHHKELDHKFRHHRNDHYKQHAEQAIIDIASHLPHWHHKGDKAKGEDKGEDHIQAPTDLTPTQTQLLQKQVREVLDAHHSENDEKPGRFVMSATGEQGVSGYSVKGSTQDQAATKALENALNVFLYYLQQYNFDSLDNKGMALISTIHFGTGYNNAFYDGKQMVYGDGDGKFFKAFVNFLDVVGHEMTHGVTGSRLDYQGEAGALNEHFSDVMGYLVLMRALNLNPATAPWVLADGILTYKGKGYPLRSFKAPGTAYDIPGFGKDPQPAKYGDLYKVPNDEEHDSGGVHTNSGIPNHAFYLFATRIHEAGVPWELVGLIWFSTMMRPGAFKPNASMADFANATIETANTLEITRNNTILLNALQGVWKEVEVLK